MAQALNGKVMDSTNRPIADALIQFGDHHCHTDGMGRFEVAKISIGDSLSVSFLGFETKDIVVRPKDLNGPVTVILREATFDLDQVTVSNSVQSVSQVTSIDLKTNPVRSAQEILRRVPGLMISQHAGGGKAEQIFLRGFDIDHGTDIAISVDGMPVNMVSHAHGQGYSDLHFLIPETIETIDFGKGPYYANQGNFNTAGYVDFRTKDRLNENTFGLEYGQFNTMRMLGLFDLLDKQENQHAYIAAEYLLSDGPVESPQNFNRLNLMAKYTANLNGGDRLSVMASHFQSKWDASGQIPQRLVDNGTITRFGAVDNTEGGQTSRTNVNLEYTKVLSKNQFLQTNVFYSQYDFELYSNFTFFLEDPLNGDQIHQRESRNIFGFQSKVFSNYSLDLADLELSYGAGLRYDDSNDNELSRTANRKETLEQLSLGDIDETNGYAFVNAEFDFGDWLVNPGLRLDLFSFDYINKLSPVYDSRSETKGRVSPKLNIIYNPSLEWQFYFKSGMGFHSNDSRVVVAREGRQILPAAYGADLGAIWKPLPRLWLNAAGWALFLEQEFVYVGDAGIVEPSGESLRRGVDLGLRYQFLDNWFVDADATYAHARSIEGAEGENFIPLAVEWMSSGGLSYQHPSGFSAGIRYRYVKDRPANEDNSITAKGFFVTDINASYRFRHLTLGFTIDNLFDVDWNEAQFATESQLLNEAEPVEEIHFTPGTPFFFKGILRYSF
jgi:outer membrane receptor protein involved in Fe transport